MPPWRARPPHPPPPPPPPPPPACLPACAPDPLPDRPPAQVAPGGRVIWRSAAYVPPYAKFIKDAGFEVRCIQRADEGYMDRVNM